MEQSTLKYLRIFIPGILFLFGIVPIYFHHFKDLFPIEGLDFSYLTFLSIMFGAVYYQFSLGRTFINFSRKFINQNILNAFIKIDGRSLTDIQKNKLKKEKKYMHIFYNLIDSDESLKKKGALVYFNGIFWSSTADSFVINFFFFLCYKFWLTDILSASSYASLFLTLSIVSIIMHIGSIYKHFKLSNDQLGYIEVHKKTKVKDGITEIL